MNKRIASKLTSDWQEMVNASAHLSVELQEQMDKKVAAARKAGKRESEYMLFLAFGRDIRRCVNQEIKPDEALRRLDTHFRAWMAGEVDYKGEPPPIP